MALPGLFLAFALAFDKFLVDEEKKKKMEVRIYILSHLHTHLPVPALVHNYTHLPPVVFGVGFL